MYLQCKIMVSSFVNKIHIHIYPNAKVNCADVEYVTIEFYLRLYVVVDHTYIHTYSFFYQYQT